MKNTTFKFLAVLSVLILSFVSAEVLSRLYLFAVDYKDTHVPCTQAESFETPGEFFGLYDVIAERIDDPQIGGILEPYDTGKGYKINGQSFRYDEDIPEKPGENEVRVFITGGSVAFGAGVNMDQVYSSVAENYIKELIPESRVRFINAGVGGVVSTNERAWIENHVIRYTPSYVIMFSGWNDTYYGQDGGSNFPKELSKAYGLPFSENKRPNINKIFPPLSTDDYVLKSIYIIELVIRNLRVGDIIYKYMIDEDDIIQIILKNNYSINSFLSDRGIKFIYYLQPSLFSTDKSLVECEKYNIYYYNKLYRKFPEYNNRIYTKLREILPQHAREYGYVYVDSDTIINKSEDGIFFDFAHMGERGNRLVGEHMAKLIHNLETSP